MGSPRPPIENRKEAGARLAARLRVFHWTRPVVLALPRGGVPVAAEIARSLGAPLDILNVRKIGAPDNPEYALGAIAEGGIETIDGTRMRDAGYTLEDLAPIIEHEKNELDRRAQLYRDGRPPLDLASRTAILVDDGVATGATMSVAIRAVQAHRPKEVVIALGVSPPDTLERLRHEADVVVTLLAPDRFFAVGEWYRDFEPVSDAEVRVLLDSMRRTEPPASPE